MHLNKKKVKEILIAALHEDIGVQDITTTLVINKKTQTRAYIFAKERCVLCGIDIAKQIFALVDEKIKFKAEKKDGDNLLKGTCIARIHGSAQSILTAERVAVNFLSFLSGISTLTFCFVKKTLGTQAKILDTRKTTPNLRLLERYAVRVGGGVNHRSGLWDGIIIKDNHLRICKAIKNKKINEKIIEKTFKRIREKTDIAVELEVESFDEFKKAAKYEPNIVMLDNFNVATLKRVVKFRNEFFPLIKLEASGGVNLTNIRKIAATGVDFVSSGFITHSAQNIDFSLEISDESV